MKICKDCTVSLKLKGLGKRKATVIVPLFNNDGERVELTATNENTEAKVDSILYIGRDAGDNWEFTVPGEGSSKKAWIPKQANVSSFNVKLEMIFDPAADENWVSVAESTVTVDWSQGMGDPCYLTCDSMVECGPSPFCLFCDGRIIKCDVS